MLLFIYRSCSLVNVNEKLKQAASSGSIVMTLASDDASIFIKMF